MKNSFYLFIFIAISIIFFGLTSCNQGKKTNNSKTSSASTSLGWPDEKGSSEATWEKFLSDDKKTDTIVLESGNFLLRIKQISAVDSFRYRSKDSASWINLFTYTNPDSLLFIEKCKDTVRYGVISGNRAGLTLILNQKSQEKLNMRKIINVSFFPEKPMLHNFYFHSRNGVTYNEFSKIIPNN